VCPPPRVSAPSCLRPLVSPPLVCPPPRVSAPRVSAPSCVRPLVSPPPRVSAPRVLSGSLWGPGASCCADVLLSYRCRARPAATCRNTSPPPPSRPSSTRASSRCPRRPAAPSTTSVSHAPRVACTAHPYTVTLTRFSNNRDVFSRLASDQSAVFIEFEALKGQ